MKAPKKDLPFLIVYLNGFEVRERFETFERFSARLEQIKKWGYKITKTEGQ